MGELGENYIPQIAVQVATFLGTYLNTPAEIGNGLNNTVSAIGQAIGQGLYDATHLTWSQSEYIKISDTTYSPSTPQNPAATPYVEGSLAVSAGAISIGAAAGTWAAAGLPTMDIAVGAGTPALIHVGYGTEGTWVGAYGTLGAQTVIGGFAPTTFADVAWFTIEGIPILFPEAVTATGVSAWTCVSAAISGFLRGWVGL